MTSRAPGRTPLLTVRPAARDERVAALTLLLGDCPPDERKLRLIDLLHSVEQGDFSLDGLFIAHADGVPVGAALAVVQPDRMAFAWPPGVVIPPDQSPAVAARDVGGALLKELGTWLDRSTARFAQVLIEPDASPDLELLREHGFVHIADLELRQRWLREPPADWTLPAWRTLTYDETTAARFAAVVERSYLGSLDCPAFTGYRTGAEALESHRAAGGFDPSLWTLFEVEGRDVGVLLLASPPEQNAWEVLYTGIVPEARGKGLGKALMEFGLRAARSAGRERLCLCVDASNVYARAVYDALEIAVEGLRTVYLRWSKGAGS